MNLALFSFLFFCMYAHSHQSDAVINDSSSQKSTLPLANSESIFDEISWSTYRPQLYFGLKTRRPNSPVFGLMWYHQDPEVKAAEQLGLRHWALDEDKVVFMWSQHDGRTFGSQQIVDGDLGMQTDWFNFGESSWMARINLSRPEWGDPQTGQEDAVILYFALQDQSSTMEIVAANDEGEIEEILENEENAGNGGNGGGLTLNLLNGESAEVGGKFALKIRQLSEGKKANLDAKSTSMLCLAEDPWMDMAKVGQMVKLNLARKPEDAAKFVFNRATGCGQLDKANFVAIQIDVKENSAIEVLFQTEKDGPTSPDFNENFTQKEEEFKQRFEEAFPIPANLSSNAHRMGRSALANLLGGIGVWHGSLWMRSRQMLEANQVSPYGPFSLLSAVPSRTGFPRGFLWDEGHHNLLIHKFDPALSLEIVGAYLDMMNIDGWIPREIVLGTEAEARMPGTFLIQEDWVANPPMFFYLLREFISDNRRAEKFRPQLARLYPRIKQLYLWLRKSQNGSLPGTFRWHDRNATTDLEVNPGAMSSGLDDYPRATHPTEDERHLDLLCWMAMSAEVLTELAKMAEDNGQFQKEIGKEAELLNDHKRLVHLYWSENIQQFCDYGLHSDSVRLIEEKSADGTSSNFHREVLTAPLLRFVEDVNGVANLFPLFMRLLPPDSPQLGPLLAQMTDPKQLWTPFGLRSLSTVSPYYMKWNSKWSSPYWRGPVWINMNYFALSALKHYALVDGPLREEFARIHDELRDNVLKNMAEQYDKTGFIWEHYNDVNGHGEGNHPFTGWSALVLAILAGNY